MIIWSQIINVVFTLPLSTAPLPTLSIHCMLHALPKAPSTLRMHKLRGSCHATVSDLHETRVKMEHHARFAQGHIYHSTSEQQQAGG